VQSSYPVTFDVTRPKRFERAQVFLRLLIIVLLSFLGSIFPLVYLAVPVLAAVFISHDGGETYLKDTKMPLILRWYLALYTYLALLIDRLPTEAPERAFTFEWRNTGSPTVGSALLRLVLSIPSALVLVLLGIAGALVALIGAVYILIQEDYPDGLYNFQLGIMRWHARLLAYHASFVDEYPPFALDAGHEPPTQPASPAQLA
jgi:hypothetical protein